jgi:hypothetical protein
MVPSCPEKLPGYFVWTTSTVVTSAIAVPTKHSIATGISVTLQVSVRGVSSSVSIAPTVKCPIAIRVVYRQENLVRFAAAGTASAVMFKDVPP